MPNWHYPRRGAILFPYCYPITLYTPNTHSLAGVIPPNFHFQVPFSKRDGPGWPTRSNTRTFFPFTLGRLLTYPNSRNTLPMRFSSRLLMLRGDNPMASCKTSLARKNSRVRGRSPVSASGSSNQLSTISSQVLNHVLFVYTARQSLSVPELHTAQCSVELCTLRP